MIQLMGSLNRTEILLFWWLLVVVILFAIVAVVVGVGYGTDLVLVGVPGFFIMIVLAPELLLLLFLLLLLGPSCDYRVEIKCNTTYLSIRHARFA